MTDDELVQYWKANHEGLSPGELAKVDPGYYKALRKRKLLSPVWESYRECLELQLLPSVTKALEEYSRQ